MVSLKIKHLCKKFRIRLTLKKGLKRVYKSERILIKQLRKKMKKIKKFKTRRKFGEKRKFHENEEVEQVPKQSFFKRHKKKLLIAGGVAASLAVLGGGHYYATRTDAGQKRFTGYNAKLGKEGTLVPKVFKNKTPKAPVKSANERIEENLNEFELKKKKRELEDKEIAERILEAKSKGGNSSEILALEQQKILLQQNRLQEEKASKEEEDRLKKIKKEEDSEKLTSGKNIQGLILAGLLPPEQRSMVLSNDPMTNVQQNLLINFLEPTVKKGVKNLMDSTKDMDELQAEYEDPNTSPERKEQISKKIEKLKEEQEEIKQDLQEDADFSEKVKNINEQLADAKTEDERNKLNLQLNTISIKKIKEDIKELSEEDIEKNSSEIEKLEKNLKQLEKYRLTIMENLGETEQNTPDNTEFGKRKRKSKRKSHKTSKKEIKRLHKDLKLIKNC